MQTLPGPAPTQIPASNRRILIIDDNRAIHDDFRKVLAPAQKRRTEVAQMESLLFDAASGNAQPADYELHGAFQGAEGIELARKAAEEGKPFAVAFIDVRMPPGLDGIETTQRLWEICPDLQVVICTAYSDYSWADLIKKLGHSDQLVILKKPFDNIEVMQLAVAMTEKWRLTRQARERVNDLESKVHERTAELRTALEQLQHSVAEKERSQAALRESEAQLHHAQRMESIGQLAGGVAHDFNNILSIINGHAEMLRDVSGFDAEARESIEEIASAGDRAAALTRQLLAFSRQQIACNRPLKPNRTIADLSKMLHRLIGEDIALELKLSPGSPTIYADASMMEQVIVNLVVNARDAMPHGGNLIIQTEVVSRGAGEFVSLSVKDTGHGIPQQIIGRIFEPFFTTKEQGKGTGLGLATVFGIVKQHGGWIDVESVVGQGTTFHVFLPIVPVELREAESVPLDGGVARGQETVLLVEDEVPVRAMASIFLQKCGYTVLQAGNGNEALEIWLTNASRIDLLLSDIIMPGGMNGLELAEKLKGSKPGLKVLFTSGYTTEKISKTLVRRKDIPLLKKPYPLRELALALRNVLDGKGPVTGSSPAPVEGGSSTALPATSPASPDGST